MSSSEDLGDAIVARIAERSVIRWWIEDNQQTETVRPLAALLTHHTAVRAELFDLGNTLVA